MLSLSIFSAEYLARELFNAKDQKSYMIWAVGDDADEMMENNDTVNNEFYTCPTYNYSIKRGRKIKTFDVDEMIGWGTYEDYIDFANK